MVLLKLNLFILNINRSPFPASGDAISHPHYAAVDKSAPYFTAIRNNNPTLPLHESINQRYDHSLTLLVVVVVVVLVADCACPLSTVTVYFLMS